MKFTPKPEPEAKKPYATPRLAVYGDIRVITNNNTMSGADGGGGRSSFSM